MSSRAFGLGVDPAVAGGQRDPRILPNHWNVMGFDHGGAQPLCEPKPFFGGYSMQSNTVVRLLRTFAALALLVVLITAAQPAQAQEAPPPFGVWWGENSGDYIVLNADGSCSFTAVSGTVNVAGWCEWLPSSVGGILTLYYPMPLEPGRVSWSIIWIDQNLMMVNGVERFHLVG